MSSELNIDNLEYATFRFLTVLREVKLICDETYYMADEYYFVEDYVKKKEFVST